MACMHALLRGWGIGASLRLNTSLYPPPQRFRSLLATGTAPTTAPRTRSCRRVQRLPEARRKRLEPACRMSGQNTPAASRTSNAQGWEEGTVRARNRAWGVS
eukprot:3222563-Rhodomonas_salina.1